MVSSDMIFLADKGRFKKTYFCMVLFVSLAFSRRLIQKHLVFEFISFDLAIKRCLSET